MKYQIIKTKKVFEPIEETTYDFRFQITDTEENDWVAKSDCKPMDTDKLKEIRERIIEADGSIRISNFSRVFGSITAKIQSETYQLGRDEEREIILEFIAKEIYGSNEEDREHIKEQLKMFKLKQAK